MTTSVMFKYICLNEYMGNLFKPALLIAPLFIAVLLSGCSPAVTSDPTSTSTTEVTAMAVVIQKIDPSLGLRFYLLPSDRNGELVAADGVVDATLWIQQPIDVDNIVRRGSMIQRWTGIQVNRSEYVPFLGVNITLEYNEDNSDLFSLVDIYGYLDVILTLNDGTILTLEKTYIEISHQYSCCGSPNW